MPSTHYSQKEDWTTKYKLTTETNVDMLNYINYLILPNPKQFVLNDYKPNNTYRK